jgi:hypothetical protein
MDPRRVVEKVTTEIIDHFRLPKKLCYPFIKKMVSCVYVAGWEAGVNQKGLKNPVVQMDEYGNAIEIHKSLTIAARKVKISKSNISAVLKGKQHTAGGFLWKKVDDPVEIRKILEGWQDEL